MSPSSGTIELQPLGRSFGLSSACSSKKNRSATVKHLRVILIEPICCSGLCRKKLTYVRFFTCYTKMYSPPGMICFYPVVG